MIKNRGFVLLFLDHFGCIVYYWVGDRERQEQTQENLAISRKLVALLNNPIIVAYATKFLYMKDIYFNFSG